MQRFLGPSFLLTAHSLILQILLASNSHDPLPGSEKAKPSVRVGRKANGSHDQPVIETAGLPE
jgi:hypothetical protein